MSEHRARVAWRHGGGAVGCESYGRSHWWTFDDGIVVEVSSAQGFLGDSSRIDPEGAFVAASSPLKK